MPVSKKGVDYTCPTLRDEDHQAPLLRSHMLGIFMLKKGLWLTNLPRHCSMVMVGR